MLKIGIDIGGTNLAGGVVNEDGKVVITDSIPTKAEEGYKAVLGRIIELCKNLIDKAKTEYPDQKVDSIGCGVPGIVKNGMVINAPNVKWKNEPLAKDLEAATGLPVTLINDATAALVAENAFGASKGVDNSAMYTLGTGVGGGLIINGKVVTGSHGVATEFGHTLHKPNFYSCNCGKNGCLETYSSATAIVKQFEHLVEQGLKTELELGDLEAKDIIDAAKNGDEAALAAFNILTDELALNMANLIDILDPEVFVVGGGVANAGDFLFDSLKDKVGKNITFKEVVGEPVIKPAQFGNDAGIIGAAYSGDYV